jgi:transposase-like protein
MSTKEQIIELFKGLNDKDKSLLLNELGDLKSNKEIIQVDRIGNCPYCQSKHIVKNGKHKGNQRYLCKVCNRNFIYSTGTALQGIKKRSQFEEYKSIMFNEGFVPLKTMSSRLDISAQTAFDWRHKILCNLKSTGSDFAEITEVDDIWFLYSQKGRQGLRYSRKRGGSKRRGDNDFQVKLLVTSDRNNTNDMSVVRIGRLKAKDIERKIGDRIGDDVTLVSDKHSSIKSFAMKNKINHVSFKSSEHIKDEVHHVQTVNSMASRLKGDLNHKLRGVSTKYLQSYANWFQFVESNKNKENLLEDNDIRLSNKDQWNTFTSIEKQYANFIKKYSIRTYRCPTKRNWKTGLKDTKSIMDLGYM